MRRPIIPLRGKKKALLDLLKSYYLSHAVLVEKVIIDKNGAWKIEEAKPTIPNAYNFILNNTPPTDYRLSTAVIKYTEDYFLLPMPFAEKQTMRSDRPTQAMAFLEKADLAFLKLIRKDLFLKTEGCGQKTWQELQLFIKHHLN